MSEREQPGSDPTSSLLLSAILKIDLSGFTKKVTSLSSHELANLLEAYDQLAMRAFKRHGGRVIKGEGDAYWCTFPSVTGAALSAVHLQTDMSLEQGGNLEEGRMRIRASITVGDVLHKGDDIFGDAVNLAARIEAVTPVDEIFLSHAARVTLNDSEVVTELVDHFDFKGFARTEPVYRVVQSHRINVHRRRVVLFTDLRGFTRFCQSHDLRHTERLLLAWGRLHKRLVASVGGRLIATIGDAFFLTFDHAESALTFFDALVEGVQTLRSSEPSFARVSFQAGATIGDLYQLQAHVFGEAAEEASRCCNLGSSRTQTVASLLITQLVAEELAETKWEEQFARLPDDLNRKRKMGANLVIYALDR